jgi:hypothetical protein
MKVNKEIRVFAVFSIVKVILISILVYCAVSCSPQRRLERLVKKHPELVYHDTLTIRDTFEIEIPGSEIKTFIPIEVLKTDTVIVKDSNNHSVTVWMRNDTIFVNSKLDTIYKTIYKERKIPVEKLIYRKPRDGLRWFWVIVLIVLVYIAVKNPN